MGDYKSGLPVRTKADGADERLHVKVVDGIGTAVNQMTVDSDKNAHVEVHGNKPTSGDDVILLLSEEGRPNPRGDYDASTNTKPASTAVVAHERSTTHDETKQNQRVTAVPGETNSVCMDVSLHDEAGQNYDQDNPLPVTFEESEGDEIHDFEEGVDIAKDANDDHEYVVVDGKTLLLYGVHFRASGRAKVELYIGDGAATEVFALKDVNINSTAKPEADMDFYRVPIKIVGTADGTTVKVTKTNTDNQAQSLYSTIIGVERDT